MKKGIALILTAALLLTGCGGASAQTNTQEKTDAPQAQEEAVATEEAPTDEAEKTEAQEPAAEAENTNTTEAEAPQETTNAASNTLVLYFSRTGEQYVVGVIDKGNTAIVAEMIAEHRNRTKRPVPNTAALCRICQNTARSLSVLPYGGATGR